MAQEVLVEIEFPANRRLTAALAASMVQVPGFTVDQNYELEDGAETALQNHPKVTGVYANSKIEAFGPPEPRALGALPPIEVVREDLNGWLGRSGDDVVGVSVDESRVVTVYVTPTADKAALEQELKPLLDALICKSLTFEETEPFAAQRLDLPTFTRPSRDVDPTRLEVVFTEAATKVEMERVLAEAEANGATEAKLMFPDATEVDVAYRFASVKLPDSSIVQRNVLALLVASEAVESAEPTPLRWLSGGPVGPGD